MRAYTRSSLYCRLPRCANNLQPTLDDVRDKRAVCILERALYIWKRGLHTAERAVCIGKSPTYCQRALCIARTKLQPPWADVHDMGALCTLERALYIAERATCIRKSHIYCWKSPVYCSNNLALYIAEWAPCIAERAPYIAQRAPCIAQTFYCQCGSKCVT